MYGPPNGVCCACDPSACPSICLFMFCMSEVISSFKSLRAGSHVFALLMLFIFVILYTMWSGNSLHLLSNLPFSILCLTAIRMMRGYAVWRRYIDVCNYNRSSVVNVYLDHLKFCVVCSNRRMYVCCS